MFNDLIFFFKKALNLILFKSLNVILDADSIKFDHIFNFYLILILCIKTHYIHYTHIYILNNLTYINLH